MSRSILIVDDEIEVLNILEERLKANGYHVMKASGSVEAAKKIKEEGVPALVLLDLEIPVVNGFGFLKALRKYKPTENTPGIMQTAQRHTANILKAQELKVTDYLSKPCKAEDLLNTIKRYI